MLQDAILCDTSRETANKINALCDATLGTKLCTNSALMNAKIYRSTASNVDNK